MKRCFSLLITSLALALSPLSFGATESFEQAPVGSVPSSWKSAVGLWQVEEGHATIHQGNASEGKQSLHLLGGQKREIILTLPLSQEPQTLSFLAERWTQQGDCELKVEVDSAGKWEPLIESKDIKVGGFHTLLRAKIPAGAKRLRFESTSERGILIDELKINRMGPMEIQEWKTLRPTVPLLTRKEINPLLGFTVITEGDLKPVALEEMELLVEAPVPSDLLALQILPGKQDPTTGFSTAIANASPKNGRIVIPLNHELENGSNSFWISFQLKEGASIDGKIKVELKRVKAQGKTWTPSAEEARVSQRLGVGLRLHGDDGSKFYRIPGLATTKKGTLLAVYDVRYHHAGDLPADIDVGINRSTDGGRTWERMKIAMDMGNDPKHGYDGIGDPAILVDEITGRIWIAALWSHGNRAWNGSGPGMKPEETGQFILVYSDDDGKTWSKPRNITESIKKPEWRLLFNGPGAGITMKDGTLVFAAQYRAEDGGETQGKPFATILWSKDRGETWHLGTGMKIDTTEAQVVELPDGSLMLNSRDNRGGSRSVYVTRDLGKTWEPHVTDRKALPESVCMASLLRVDTQQGPVYYFSNPAVTNGRYNMTLKRSLDAGATWPEEDHKLYDSRHGLGYSCLAPIGHEYIGVLYEGISELFFLRIPVNE